MKHISIIIASLLFVGCASLGTNEVKPVVVEHRTANIPVFHPPLPDKADIEDIEWKVLTPEIMEEYLIAYKKGEAPVWVFYGITPEGYKSLAHDIAELKRVIKNQKSIIMYYRDNVKEMSAPEITK